MTAGYRQAPAASPMLAALRRLVLDEFDRLTRGEQRDVIRAVEHSPMPVARFRRRVSFGAVGPHDVLAAIDAVAR